MGCDDLALPYVEKYINPGAGGAEGGEGVEGAAGGGDEAMGEGGEGAEGGGGGAAVSFGGDQALWDQLAEVYCRLGGGGQGVGVLLGVGVGIGVGVGVGGRGCVEGGFQAKRGAMGCTGAMRCETLFQRSFTGRAKQG